MATYRNIQMSFWTDSKVSGQFSPNEKLMYLYLMTNPHTNLCGCYEISKKQIAFETGFSAKMTDNLLKKLGENKVIDYSEETNEVLIINWHKYNWTTSEKLRKALAWSISHIMHGPYRQYLYDLYKGKHTVWDEKKYSTDTVSIPYGYNGNVSFRLVTDSLGNSLGNSLGKTSKDELWKQYEADSLLGDA